MLRLEATSTARRLNMVAMAVVAAAAHLLKEADMAVKVKEVAAATADRAKVAATDQLQEPGMVARLRAATIATTAKAVDMEMAETMITATVAALATKEAAVEADSVVAAAAAATVTKMAAVAEASGECDWPSCFNLPLV